MVRRALPNPEVVAEWQAKLADATTDRENKRAQFERSDEVWRILIRDAFDAGLTVKPICEATGLTESWVYKIKRGVRT